MFQAQTVNQCSALSLNSRRTPALTINSPDLFQRPDFLAWLNNGAIKFTWHTKGEATEFSDVIVLVDPILNGEGSDSDMPRAIWDQIIEECKKHFKPQGFESHIMVHLVNMQ